MTPITIAEIKRRNRGAGQFWFSPSTMRHFSTRIESLAFGPFFVTSEQFTSERFENGPRLYTVRKAMPDGSIDTVGEFQQYQTLRAAKAAAQQEAWLADHVQVIPVTIPSRKQEESR